MTALQSVSSSLTAGYSAENAFAEACKELEKLYYAEEPVCRELHRIKRMLSVNENLEALLADWAARSGSADIRNFAAVFSAAKRTGGDLNAIIRNTISIMTQKREAQQEIEVSLASRKMEQKVMSGIPPFYTRLCGTDIPGISRRNVLYSCGNPCDDCGAAAVWRRLPSWQIFCKD